MNIVLALLFLVGFPGLALGSIAVRRPLPEIAWFSLAGAMGLLWTTLGSLALTLLRVPLTPTTTLLLGLAPGILVLSVPALRATARRTLATISWNPRAVILWSVTVILLAVPLTTIHDGLPTGDVQKSIFWAERIARDHRLPDYRDALALNRDPADFLTPGLHTLTAAMGTLSSDPLRGSAWLSFTASIILAGLASTLAALVTKNPHAPILAFLFASLNLRFLRYAFFPGYHYQNLFGEMLLLLTLVALMDVLASGGRRLPMVILGGSALVALPLVHQFSAFLALFLVPLALVTAAVLNRRALAAWWIRAPRHVRVRRAITTLVVLLTLLTIGARSPLQEKLPHLVTRTPHLAGVLIPLTSIPSLLGPPLFFFGVAGMLVARRAQGPRHDIAMLVAWTLMLLLLGQGPRFFLDIPSARTLFTAAVPLAVLAGMFVAEGTRALPRLFPRAGSALTLLVLTLALVPLGQTAAQELTAVSHGTRVNTTLTKDTLDILEELRAHATTKEGTGILIDDWNHRRLTWTLLSPYRMLTRVGGDLRTIADEAAQSPLRKQLYEHHLDFEKVFMLGNHSAIRPLLERYGIALIGTANGLTDDVFAQSPLLREIKRTDAVTVYEIIAGASPTASDPEASFLLARTTLVNDVGDAEDVLPHTAVSLAATRIGEPMRVEGRTVRAVESEVWRLRVNVDTYVRPLWDADRDGRVDHPARLLLRLVENGARGTITTGETRLGTFELPASSGFTDLAFDIPQGALLLDTKGFAELGIVTDEGPLVLDLVAVGIS